MTVTFLSEARSNAAKRSSRRIRPAVRETPVEVGRELGTGPRCRRHTGHARTLRAHCNSQARGPACIHDILPGQATSRICGLEPELQPGSRHRKITSIR